MTTCRSPFVANAHNVVPAMFRRQLEYLKQKFTIVDLRNLGTTVAGSRAVKPLVAICFDDNYRCVFDEAYPVLEQLKIPAVVFVNSSTVGNRRLMWRDKIRYLISKNMQNDFVGFLKESEHRDSYQFENLGQLGFYRWSKNPASIGSWENLIEDLRKFFLLNELEEESIARKFNLYGSRKHIVDSEFLGFGNHTESHPPIVMLSGENQRREITNGKAFLHDQAVQDVGFALPFSPYNMDTLRICYELGYRFIYTTNGFSTVLPKEFGDELLIIDRLLAAPEFSTFRRNLRLRRNKRASFRAKRKVEE